MAAYAALDDALAVLTSGRTPAGTPRGEAFSSSSSSSTPGSASAMVAQLKAEAARVASDLAAASRLREAQRVKRLEALRDAAVASIEGNATKAIASLTAAADELESRAAALESDAQRSHAHIKVRARIKQPCSGSDLDLMAGDGWTRCTEPRDRTGGSQQGVRGNPCGARRRGSCMARAQRCFVNGGRAGSRARAAAAAR